MKQFFRNLSPSRERLNQYRVLNWFNKLAHDKPGVWGFTRNSVSPSFAIGLFWAMIPMPMQMPVAAYSAYRYGCNIPLAVALVWISNPITMLPIVYYEYLLGSYILDMPLTSSNMEFTFDYIRQSINEIWQPLLLGAFIFAVSAAAVGYATVNYLWVLQIKFYKADKQNKRPGSP